MKPGNDERDPLDHWLRHEIPPLPPPSGTFELITKRARRRKFRKLAVTVTSVAAAAAAVTVAVPTVLSLRLGHPAATGSQAANAGSASPTASAGAAPLTRSATPATPSPTATPTGGISESTQAAGLPAGGPVPPNFQPTSVTFISKSTGWAIGQAGTPGTCANPNASICTSIVLTENGGRTWRGVPAPSTNGVSGIRFLDGRNGWAYGAQLWSTHDYGNHWGQVAASGQRVIDLETAGSQAFGLFATCASGNPGDCSSYTLEATAAGTDNWAPVGAATTGLPGIPGMTPSIVLTGTTGWLLAADGTIYSGSLGGAWSKIGTAPCPATPSTGATVPGDALLTRDAYTGALAATCFAKPATSGGALLGAQLIYTSADGGRSWLAPVAGPGRSAITSLASAPGAPAILATTAGLEVLPAGHAAGRLAQALAGGFSYVGMTTDTQGVALPANTALHQIWMTRDGGQSWQPALTSP